jgi:3-oxoadipate enol-lactonase
MMQSKVDFAVYGSKEAVWITLSHPIGSCHTVWAQQVAVLSQHYRVLTYTLRGHGADHRNDASCTVDDLADDVLQLWQTLGVQRSHFIGLSLGGCIGVALAHRAPQRVLSLVVVNARLEMDTTASDMWQQRAKLVESQGMAEIVTPTLERWLSAQFMAASPDLVEPIRHALSNTSARGFAACARALAEMRQQQRLTTLQVPTLFIGGVNDKAVSYRLLEHYSSLNPKSAFVALAGPHLLNVENPLQFNQTVLDFLAHQRVSSGVSDYT